MGFGNLNLRAKRCYGSDGSTLLNTGLAARKSSNLSTTIIGYFLIRTFIFMF